MKKSLSVLLSVLIIMSVMSCCFGVSASAADDVIAFRYDALGFAADENGLAANIDFGKNIIRGFDVGVEGYGDYITAGKEGLYPLFETGSAIGTGDRVKVTTEQGNAETAVADYETVVYGDLDGDGYLDVLDAVLVERVSTGAYVPAESDFADGGMSYAAFVEAADVNCDGQINEFDYSALVDAALGGAKIDQHRVRASWVEDIHSEIEAQAFTGLEITPDFDVDLCGKLLDADSDYDVTFSKNIEIGEAYITVSAKKDSLYSGEKTFTFEIKSIIEIVCREIGKMLEKCGINDCISVNYDDETSVVDVIFDGDVLLALELNPDRDALTDIYSELMSLFGKVYAERKLTVGGVTVGENGVKNYAGINEIKNELRNALREFENAEENLVKSFDGVIASETVNENFKVNVKFDCSDADVLCGGLAALDGFVAFGTDEAEPELTVIDVNIPEAYARELAAEYDDIYSAVEDFGEMNVNSFIGKFAELQTSDITAENGSVINMFTDVFGKMNILVTDILAERDIRISADGSEYINAYNGNAFNSENGSTADIGSFFAALGELADLESVNASAFDNGRGDYCAYVKVGYADSEYVKNYKLNINVFGTLVDELENTACDYTALTNAINNANTVLAGGTVYTSASLEVVNEKLAAANGVPAGLLNGVNCENQKLIDNAANELNLAVAALINKADYTKLEEAKSAAAVIKADGKDYTDDTMAVLDNALSDANGLSADLSFEYQQTVDAAAKAINDAIAALKINADYTALNEAKEDAAEIKANGKVYTNATMSVLDSALTAAEGVPAGLTIESQQTIDDAATALDSAIAALKEKADYSALETAKANAAAKKEDGNDYTEATMAVLDSALDAADKISADLSVECQQTVTNAANAINNAIAALKIKADYTELNAAKEAAAAKKSDPKIYTDATLLVLETALNAAAEIPENLTSESQQLIDEAAAAINNAIAALEEKADYTQLDAAKQAAANVNFATYIVYTEESLAAFNTALENANALSTDLSVDYQQVIDDAAAALNDAITSLKIKADYIALNEAKAAAAEIKANGKVYTNATMSALDAALADADKVPENLTSESQQLIDDAAAAVNNAITALKEKANYSVLESAVQLAAGIKTNGNDYFEDTMAVLDSALEAAGKIFDDLSVDDQQIIDDAESAILNAIAALKIKADYTALNEAKTAAAEKKNDGKVYTTATMSVLDSALTAAEGVAANLTIESQQTIDNAAVAINNAIAALKVKADYSALETAKADAAAKKADGNDYTANSMAVLDNALAAAAEISADLSVDEQQTIDNAAKAINDAIAALKIPADYTALNEAKAAAQAKKNDGVVYTTESMAALDSALTAAEGVAADLTSESQQLIDDAAAAINNAIAALVEYVDPSEVNNIAVKLANTSKYLYRIGNANAVALSYLFEAKGEVNSADVVLTVTTVEGTAACTYTANTTAWQNGTVKFSGEGVVKLSIKHTKAPATELYLEVVNGKNFTSASGLNATSANAVLLSDITHTGNFSVSNGYTLYGNGFTVNGSFHKNSSSLLCGFVTLNNGTLDNVVIRHAVYPEQNLYRDSASKDGAYFNYVVSAVYVEGSGGKIVNSFISGGRAAVYVVGSKVEITDSTLYGGSVANIHADGENTIVLTNVTTVQVPMLACDGSRSVKGLGVVLGQYAMGTKIVLNGYLKQYNWITADDEQYIVDTQMMGSVLNAALSSDFARTVGGKKYANAGIVGMFEDALLITDNRTNTDVTYEYKQITVRVSIASMTGGSYNIVSGGDPLAEIPEYEATAQSVIAPAVKYQSSQNVEMSGDSLNIPVAAKVMKYGTEIPYEVYYNGQKVTSDSITVTNKGDYTLTYKYADSMIYGAGGVRTGESFNYSTDVTVKVTKAATKTITMTYDKTNAVYYWVKAGTAFDPDWSSAVPLLEGLVIKSEDEQGNVVEIFNGAGMGRIPDNLGLEITSVSGFISGATATQVSYNGQMYAYGTGKFDNNKTAHNITVKYKYTDEYNKEHTLSVTWNITASTTGTEVSESKFKDSGTQKYVALFEACGGYCATGFAAVTSGTNITLPSATREGYKFNGWYSAETGGTKLGDAGATYKMSAADVTFYAHWVASRTLTFNACGGTYSVTTAKYFDGDTVTLAKPEYSGFYFMGWCESEGGNGERYTSKFVMPDKDVTLYAIWSETPPAEFTVKFDVNGGPGSVAQMIAKDGEDLVLPAAPAREGYTFNGWFTAASGGTRIGGAGDEVKFTENTDLFAQWSVNSYNVTTSTDSATITLTANGQSVSSGASVAYGTVLKVELSYGGTGNRTFTVTGAAYYSDEACLNATTSTEPGTYYIKMPANNITLSASSSCFATGTLITLADGSQKKIEDITFGDKILAWDFFTGSYAEKEISLLVYHGDDEYTVVNTVYSDGTVLRTIGEHGVFDYDLNKFVYITAENCTDYIGHRFVKYVSKDAYEIVTMVDAYTETEVTGSYSISSAGTSNAIAEGLLTVAPPEDFYNWIEMDGKLHYDVEQFNADVEKYGLYDYEVFSDYVSYEQFVAFNGAYLKIPVEKGLFTFDYIIELINLYSQWMPE